jgi:hypothetical protein
MSDKPNNDFSFRKEKEKYGTDPCKGCHFEELSGKCYKELVKNKIFENLGSCGDDSTIFIKNDNEDEK